MDHRDLSKLLLTREASRQCVSSCGIWACWCR